MTRFDSVVIGGELVSEHYLAEEFAARVRATRAVWAEREEYGKRTPRKGLASLAGGSVWRSAARWPWLSWQRSRRRKWP